MLVMTLLLSVMMGVTIYTFSYYVSMPVDAQSRNLAFYQSTENNGPQSLVSMVPIGNSKSGIFNAHNSDVDIFMENEYYNLEIDFVVQETEANLQNGNLYLSAKLTSFSGKEDPVLYHRMGHIKQKASVVILVK